jgi:hypothetical protein
MLHGDRNHRRKSFTGSKRYGSDCIGKKERRHGKRSTEKKERYPELAELEGNRVASIEISVRYGDKEKCTSERVITRMVAEIEERDYFNDLHQLRLATVRKGRKKGGHP